MLPPCVSLSREDSWCRPSFWTRDFNGKGHVMARLGITFFLFASVLTAAPTPSKDEPPAELLARLRAPWAPSDKKDPRPQGGPHALAFVNEQLLWVAGPDGWQSWDVGKRQARQEKPVGSLAFNIVADHKRVLIGGATKVHHVEPPESATLEPRTFLKSASNAVRALAYAPASGRVAFNDGERVLTLWHLPTDQKFTTLTLESPPVAVQFALNGRLFAVASRDGSVRVFGIGATGDATQLWAKRVLRTEQTALAFHPDGRLLAVGAGGRVLLLDGATGQTLRAFDRRFGEGNITTVAIAPSGLQVAAGNEGAEGLIRVWNVLDGQERAIYRGHLGSVESIAFAPNGKVLASIDNNAGLFLWNVPSLAMRPEPELALAEAWATLDTLDPKEALRRINTLAGGGSASIELLQKGVLSAAEEQARLLKLMTQLDSDEFRIREAARKSLIQAGLRAMPLMKNPQRPKMGAEGEQRVTMILEEFENQGLRGSESGLYGETLRHLRAVRILENLDTPAARKALQAIAAGQADLMGTKEAKAALTTLPARE